MLTNITFQGIIDVRTPEQIEADEALQKAITECYRAYGTDDNSVITDYVVMSASYGVSEDGESFYTYQYLVRDCDMPWYRILGLIEVVSRIMRKSCLEGEGEDLDGLA